MIGAPTPVVGSADPAAAPSLATLRKRATDLDAAMAVVRQEWDGLHKRVELGERLPRVEWERLHRLGRAIHLGRLQLADVRRALQRAPSSNLDQKERRAVETFSGRARA